MALTFEKLREYNLARQAESFATVGEWSPTDLACCVAGEVGEACNLIKDLKYGEDVLLKDVAYELADVAIYLDLLCAKLGINLGQTVEEKFDIVSERVGSQIFLAESVAKVDRV